MIKNVGEVFADAKAAETKEERADIIGTARARVAINEILKIASGISPFLPSISDGSVAYTPSTLPYPYNDLKLINGCRMFHIFRNPRLDPVKVKNKFIQFLEGLHADEAEILANAVQGRIDVGLSIQEALASVGLGNAEKSVEIVEQSAPQEEPEAAPEPIPDAPAEPPPKPKYIRKSRRKPPE